MRTGVEEMREKDNKIPTDDIDTFGFTEEELESWTAGRRDAGAGDQSLRGKDPEHARTP